MKKKPLIITIISIGMIAAAVGAYFYLTPREATEKQMEKDVEYYLYNDRGYTEEEVLDIDIRFNAWKETGIHRYNAVVYFADEPKSDYGFMYMDGEIAPSYFGNGQHNPE